MTLSIPQPKPLPSFQNYEIKFWRIRILLSRALPLDPLFQTFTLPIKNLSFDPSPLLVLYGSQSKVFLPRQVPELFYKK